MKRLWNPDPIGLAIGTLLAFMIAFTLLLLAGRATLASDMPARNPMGPQTATAYYDWSGFLVGAHGGYAKTDASGSILGAISYSPDPDGYLYGLDATAQQQYGSLVLGVQADISKASIKGTSGVTGPGGAIPGVSASYDISWLATAQVKVGLAMDRWLPFVTAGGACAQGQGTATLPPSFNSSDTYHCGWVAGVGVNYALADNLIATVRGEYFDLGEAQVAYQIPGAGGLGLSTPLDLSGYVVKAGLALKF